MGFWILILNQFDWYPWIKWCQAPFISQYAINALGKSASGYLLKPVNIGELKNLIQKVSDEFLEEHELLQIEETVNFLSTPDFEGENIILDVEHGFIIENSRNSILLCTKILCCSSIEFAKGIYGA